MSGDVSSDLLRIRILSGKRNSLLLEDDITRWRYSLRSFNWHDQMNGSDCLLLSCILFIHWLWNRLYLFLFQLQRLSCFVRRIKVRLATSVASEESSSIGGHVSRKQRSSSCHRCSSHLESIFVALNAWAIISYGMKKEIIVWFNFFHSVDLDFSDKVIALMFDEVSNSLMKSKTSLLQI